MIFESFCEADTFELGVKIGREAKPGDIYTLIGDLGVGKTAQTLFLNHTDYDGEYIGDLILLIGPNNAGKSNLLDALNLLNENLSFSSNDLPNAIKNESKDTFIRLYEYPSDDEENNDGAKEIITKYTYGEKNPPKETFSE